MKELQVGDWFKAINKETGRLHSLNPFIVDEIHYTDKETKKYPHDIVCHRPKGNVREYKIDLRIWKVEKVK